MDVSLRLRDGPDLPVVLGNQSLGFEFERTDGGIELTKDGTILNPTEGKSTPQQTRRDTIQPVDDALEQRTNQLCSKSIVLRSGQGTIGWEVAQGFSLGDRTVRW